LYCFPPLAITANIDILLPIIVRKPLNVR